MDVTGDGRPDLVTSVGTISRNTPTGPGGSPEFSSSRFGITPAESRTVAEGRYGFSTELKDDIVWRQAIDVDGDGRVDLIAVEAPGTWSFYLNTPDPADHRNVVFQRRVVSVAALAQHLRERNLWNNAEGWVPLGLRTTGRERVFHACAIWNPLTRVWDQFFDPDREDHCPANDVVLSTGSETTITAWELKDINGDGYPDVVFNSSPVIVHSELHQFPPPTFPKPHARGDNPHRDPGDRGN
jgi:hypothetical protein